MSFTIAAGPRQRIHSRVRIPWDSRLYFTVSQSDSRLPFTSPQAVVEVFDPASTQEGLEYWHNWGLLKEGSAPLSYLV
jgi:hypothetical protein